VPELNEAFQSREREIAASVGVDAALATRLDATAGRRRRGRHVGIAASAVVGMGAVIGSVLLFAPSSQNDPIAPVVSESPTVTVTETPSPSPSPSATQAAAAAPSIIEGFAPVPQLPAEEIPWDEVGPGWFLVDYRNDVEIPNLQPTEEFIYPQLSGGLSLVSPDGDWFAASTLDALGAGVPTAWDGSAVWMELSVENAVETGISDLNIVDLEGSRLLGALEGIAWEGTGEPISPGKAFVYTWGGDGVYDNFVGIDVAGMGGCSQATTAFQGWEPDDMSFLYSSAGGGRLVCFGEATDSTRTVVTLVDVQDVSSSREINEFQYDSSRYSFVGWIDDNRFLFARTMGYHLAAEKVFTYDLTDDSITDTGLDVYSSITPWTTEGYVEGYFDRVSQRHVITRTAEDSWTVSLYRLDGSAAATIQGECDGRTGLIPAIGLRTSGGRLMVTCADPGYVAMYDMASGAEIGTWQLGSDRSIRVFDHPDA